MTGIDPARRGAAVVLAIVILASLLLMGLPFLYSQTMARAGSQTFRAQQATGSGRETAFDLAMGLGELANSEHMGDETKLHSTLDGSLEAQLGTDAAWIEPERRNEVVVDLEASTVAGIAGMNPTDAGATRVGLTMIDEHGKIDVNDLTVEMWNTLLSRTDAGGNAQDLHDLRFHKLELTPPEEPVITDLNELMYDRSTGQTLLDREDIERIRPFVTAHGISQARERLVDLGSLIYYGKRLIVTITESPPAGAEYARIRIPGQGARRNLKNWSRPASFSVPRHYADAQIEVAAYGPSGKIEDLSWSREDIDSLIFDGFTDDAILPGGVLVLEKPDPSGGAEPEQFRIRLDDTFEVLDEGLRFDFDTGNRIHQEIDDFTSPFKQDWEAHLDDPDGVPPPLPWKAARELPAPVNVHHAPDLVRELLGLPSSFPPAQVYTGYTQNQELFDRLGLRVGPDVDEELPPLSLRSWGVCSYRVRSTTGDVRDRMVAAAGVSGTAQLPSTAGVAFRWNPKQADWEIADRHRYLANLSTWPLPMERITDPIAAVADLDNTGWTQARVLQAYDEDHLPPALADNEWILPLRGVASTALLNGSTSGSVARDDIRPDGVELSAELAFPAADQMPVTQGSVGDFPRVDARGRQFALWFKPVTDWGSSLQPLIELRMPEADALPQIDGTAGDPEYQNLWRLEYDDGYLVLYLANPNIEHTTNASRSDGTERYAPEDDFDDASLYFNEQSLGGTSGTLLSPARPFNRVEYRYHCGELDADKWYHLHVSVSHDRPGGQAVILDGVVGRDAIQLDPGATLRRGDHLTLPCAVLVTPLDAVDLVAAGNGEDLVVDSLECRLTNVHVDLGLELAEVLPARGTVLIGNEYISYESISGNSLENCYRALRQNTNTDASPPENWPKLEDHPEGSLVVPGGYRYRPDFGTNPSLLHGEVATLHLFGDGDPAANQDTTDIAAATKWRNWAKASDDEADYAAVPDLHAHPYDGSQIDPASPVHIFINPEQLTIPDSMGGPDTVIEPITSLPISDVKFVDQMPPKAGIIRIAKNNKNLYYYYEDFDGQVFSGLEHLDGSVLSGNPGPPGASNTDAFIFEAGDSDAAPYVWLVSLEVDAATDITAGANFRQSGGHDIQLFQIERSDNGRIEWIHYDGTLIYTASGSGAEHRYFLNWNGWKRDGVAGNEPSRGQQRTIFHGDYVEQGFDTGDDGTFPAGSRILPVQNDFRNSHWLATGDVVTLMNDAYDQGTQFVVRFAATDGYVRGSDPGPPSPGVEKDTKNEWFTFTERVPSSITLDGNTLLSDLCWSGKDLTPLNPIGDNRFMKGHMPVPSRMAADLYLASSDPTNGDGGMANAWIDNVASADQPGYSAGYAHRSIIRRAVLDTSLLATIDDSDDMLGIYVEVDNRAIVANDRYGLITVGGECWAYENRLTGSERGDIAAAIGGPPGNNWVKLIGRSLLGSHRGTYPLDLVNLTGPAIMLLPLGPVEELQSPLAPTYQGRVRGVGDTAPASLIASPDGTRMELIQTNDRKIFPWMRGIYNTQVQDWSTDTGGVAWSESEGLRPIAIGWWPRWPSALPAVKPSHLGVRSRDGETVDEWAAALRSRNYVWAGMPLRTLGFAPESAVHTATAEPGFTIRARALAEDFDWNDSRTFAGLGSGLDGAEYRLHWHYAGSAESDFLDVMARINDSPPRLEEVTLRGDSASILLERRDAK